MRNTLVLCCVAALSATIGTASAQDWTKSKWGPNDEIGAANYMTPELVVKAASLVKTGKTYALGIPVDAKTPAYPPRTFKITMVQPGQAGSPGLGPNKATYNDDILDTWVGIGSQLDGLGHLGVEHVYYNGNKLADFADPNGLKKLGIEKVPPMVDARRAARHGRLLQHRRGRRKAPPSTSRRSRKPPRSRTSRSARATSSSSTPAGSA